MQEFNFEHEPIDFEPEIPPEFDHHSKDCQCPDCVTLRSNRNGAYWNGFEWEELV